jgi:hypothetical protein
MFTGVFIMKKLYAAGKTFKLPLDAGVEASPKISAKID